MLRGRTAAMQRHPAGTAPRTEKPTEVSAYRRFLDALEELKLVAAIHGQHSHEAAAARAYVDAQRSSAAQAWRQNDHTPSAA